MGSSAHVPPTVPIPPNEECIVRARAEST
jgi:hypothetical protein